MSDKSTSLSTLASNIKQGVDNRIKDLHTSMPGIVQSFDAVTQLASIQPAIRRVFITRDGETETLEAANLPQLINVPVIFPRGGGFSFTFPVAAGDECLLVFCERSIDYWHQFGTVREPGARRFHDLSDATAFVGLSSVPNKIPNYDPINTVLKKDDDTVFVALNADGSLHLNATDNIHATSASDIIATCQNVTATAAGNATVNAPTIQLNGNTTIDGTLTVTGVASAPTLSATTSLTVAGKEMSNHTHIGSPTAPNGVQSNTGTPV